ncbi:hypothetical protein [Saccharothrix violaceirubra]|uniref:Uncharacterized protein n=1 Tax=Saccharothrix violaceirubra TaxID=413306 RepID=A0A7W7WVH4_9PSEU|nr:hypothetical protein [Saccharothrix violaceirubra]MBB4965344.1 hypothetical protein [Saccharothrix violaceirubra]
MRVTTSGQETARQHDALDGIRAKVFEARPGGTLARGARRC